MLRGVNVGGNNKLKMDALRSVFASLQLKNPATYLQSGNVVFQAAGKDIDGLAGRIADAIDEKFGFRPDTILRTTSDMRKAVARNPFAGRPDVEPNKLVVHFHDREPGPAKVRMLRQASEEVHLVGRELYVYYPDGQGKSKLAITTSLDQASKAIASTGRNWNTVMKLLEMAEALE